MGSLHHGQVIPGRLLLSSIDQAKGIVALVALVAACVQRRKPEPWLSKALADAWSTGVHECGWMIESLASDEMAELFREAHEADEAFLRQFEEDVRAGRTGVPLED